jgi:hypothetical protein
MRELAAERGLSLSATAEAATVQRTPRIACVLRYSRRQPTCIPYLGDARQQRCACGKYTTGSVIFLLAV